MRTLAAILLFSLQLSAGWVSVSSGPFTVYTDAGERRAGELLSDLEQFRWVLGNTIGTKNLDTVWPIRYVVFKSSQDAAARRLPEPMVLGPTGWLSTGHEKQPFPAEWWAQATRRLLEVNTGRLPASYERGLARLFSTISIDRTRIRIGEPVAKAQQDLDWARMHLLAVSRDYSGRLPVLLRNMEKMIDNEPAYRNSLGKSEKELEAEVQAYMSAGQFSSASASGRPINPHRDFYPEEMDDDEAELILAHVDSVITSRTKQALATYRKYAQDPGAQTGLGVLALAQGNQAEARQLFEKAAQAKKPPARALYELGRLENDPLKGVDLLVKAAEANPKWAEPHAESARRAPAAQAKALHWAEATKRSPRNMEWWEELAKARMELRLYQEAGRAYASAAAAAPTAEERDRLLAMRGSVDQQKASDEFARREAERQAEKDKIEALKQETLARLQKLANEGQDPDAPKSTEPVQMLFGGKTPNRTVKGLLKTIECKGSLYLLRVTPDQSEAGDIKLAVRDINLILVEGGELIFKCGNLPRPLPVSIQYAEEKDDSLGTAGETAIITLRK